MPPVEFRAVILAALHDMMQDAGYSLIRSGQRADGMSYVVLSEVATRRTSLHLGNTPAEAMGWAILDATDLARAPRTDRLDANRVARMRLSRAIQKLLPSKEDDDL